MTIKEVATKEMADRSKRDFATRAVLEVISQGQSYASENLLGQICPPSPARTQRLNAKKGLDYLLGEIRDLELERNKLEMDAAHWKEKFEDAERTIREAETHIGQTVR